MPNLSLSETNKPFNNRGFETVIKILTKQIYAAAVFFSTQERAETLLVLPVLPLFSASSK